MAGVTRKKEKTGLTSLLFSRSVRSRYDFGISLGAPRTPHYSRWLERRILERASSG